MDNTHVVISVRDLKAYVDMRERKAQVRILKRIKPYGNGKRIDDLINRIINGTLNKKTTSGTDKKKNRVCEVIMTASPLDGHKDYSDIEQYMVREED